MSKVLVGPLGLALSALLMSAAPSAAQSWVQDRAPGECGGLLKSFCPPPPPQPEPVAEAPPEPAPPPAPKPIKKKKPVKAAAVQQPAAAPAKDSQPAAASPKEPIVLTYPWATGRDAGFGPH